ncbi:MAG: hypothetical protein BGO90_10690 [Legionella sp. 40-6]|nr:MAG: hypothetical protein BGO90_10690 [Legionella sp. 40-6]
MANPQKLFLPVIIDPEYSYQFVNVKLQQQNAQSLLFWVKRLISVRARYKALSQGSIRFLSSTNNKILAFIREYEDTKVVVVANLSRYTQTTHIDFTEYEHYEPLEVFGQNAFPRVTQESYFLVLAPYGYLWLELQNNQISEQRLIEPPLKQVDTIESFFKQHKYIEEALREYLPSCRWFRSKNDKITQIRVLDQFEIKKSQTYLFLLNIDFAHQRPENYFVTLHASDKKPEKKPYLLKIANAHSKHYYLVEAEHSPTAMSHLFLQFRTKKIINGNQGKISIHANSYAQKIVDNKINPEDLTPLSKEQSNTSVAFNDQAILKIFRLQEEGENPEVEISTQLKNFKEHISAKIAAVIDYETEQKKSTIAIINEYISNEGTAWDLSINLLEHALEQIHFNAEDLPEKIVFPWDRLVVPPHGDEELGVYREIVKKLAQKTASMHLLLASIKEKNFTPESFTLFDQRSMYQGLNHLLNKTAKKLSTVDQRFDFNSAPFAKFCKQLLHNKLGGKKIRCHGDYHLGQILYTGMDFIIIDYEGEPVRAVSERKLKRSPLKDIAGMLRSFHYVLHKLHQEKSLDIKAMDYLYSNLCQRFMQEYLKKAHILLPDDEENIAQLLKGFMMEKTLYEIIYEIDNRPDWISIPYHGLHYLL